MFLFFLDINEFFTGSKNMEKQCFQDNPVFGATTCFFAVGLKNQVFDPHPNIFQDMKYGSTGCGCVGVYI